MTKQGKAVEHPKLNKPSFLFSTLDLVFLGFTKLCVLYMYVHCMNVNEYLIVVDFCTHFMYVGSSPVKSRTMRHNWDPFQQYHSKQ